MRNKQAVLEYWQAALQQEAINAVTPVKVKNHWHVISMSDCSSGKLTDQATLESLLLRGTSMLVAPYYAQKGDQYFFPYLLSVELNPGGKFVPRVTNALPIIPKAVLEPSELAPISLGFADSFNDYMIMQPPIWADDSNLLTWANQFTYAQQLMAAVVNDTWMTNLQKAGFTLQSNALIFALSDICKPTRMNVDLLGRANKIQLISAERNSGKSSYARRQIINAWLDAGVKQMPPPEYVWLEHGQPIKYSNIFECLPDTEELRVDYSNLEIIKQALHQKLCEQFNAYIKGKQVVRNWQEMSTRLRDKYADKGGIEARIMQLRNNFKDARIHNRHIQVLHSIWLRQLELVPTWSRVLDILPYLQKRRLKRLHNFFRQNFHNEEIQNLKQRQIEDLMADKRRRAENSERFIGDALHQIENDLQQEQLVRDKCLQWCEEQNLIIEDLLTIQAALEDQIWHNLVTTAIHYWQAEFRLNNGYNDYLHRVPQKIELLLVEHAEYVSPMQAAELLAITQRVIVMGNYNSIVSPRYAVQTDFELTKQFKLANYDEEFEDLQFDGIAGSTGNMWNLVTQGNEADQIFTKQNKEVLTYETVNIQGVSADYYGSKVNLAEVKAIINWINNNRALAMSGQVTIYTCFSAQARQIQQGLYDNKITQVQVRLIQDPCFVKSEVILFSSVYSIEDEAPYVFDRGTEMLDNLVANTTQRLILVGDMRLFNADLHSAAGKFAKLFLPQHIKTTNILSTLEVNCV